MKNKIDIIANSILFLSSLLLLIDIAPSDFSSIQLKRIKAVENLKTYQNISRHIPGVTFISQTQKYLTDDATFETLKELISANSPAAKKITWNSVVGIKYDIISLPTSSFDIRTLYVIIMPSKDSATELIPVGELQDLDKWIYARHQGSLTFFAFLFLVIGFFIQLISSFVVIS